MSDVGSVQATTPAGGGGARWKLSAMFFAQYFVWGAWWVPFGAYLSHHGLDAHVGSIFSTQGWAAVAAPLFVGVLADRLFPAEKVMAVLHLLGGGVLFGLSWVGADPALTFAVCLGYLLCYMPTIALSNAIAFNALSDPERQFPAIRVFGTIGWIVAGLIVGAGLHAETTALPMRLAAAASVLYGLGCFALPSTPPRVRGERLDVAGLFGLDMLRGVRDRGFWVLIACSLVLMLPLSFYYAYANAFLVAVGVPAAATVQAIGQVSEIGFLLALPWVFRGVGIKGVLVMGMLAWGVRYSLFAYGYTPSGPRMPELLAALALHGACFDFFFVAGQIWVDKRFGPAWRNRAQAFLALVTWGAGSVIGGLIANAVYVAHTAPGGAHDWRGVWLVPAGLALVVGAAFAVLFRERRGSAGADVAPAA